MVGLVYSPGSFPHSMQSEGLSMAMTDGQVPRFASLVREALAVLAAILAAFALDAWWDDRVERRAMFEALQTVAMEVQRNLSELDTTIEYNEDRVLLSRRALAMSMEELNALDDQDVQTFINMPNYELLTLELGAITAFIEGGFLPVVEDLELRALLAGLPRLQTELDEEGGVMQAAMQRFTPQLIATMPDEILGDPMKMLGTVGTRATIAGVIENRQAREAFVERTFVLGFLYAAELARTREQLVFVRDQLNQALAAR